MNFFFRIGVVLMVGFLPIVSSAHTRWFASGELAPYQTSEPRFFYLLICAAGAMLAILSGIYLHQHGFWRLTWLKPVTDYAYDRAAATFAMVTGSFLLIAGTHQYLFSPNMVPDIGVPMLLIYIQIVIGVAFLLGIATRTAAMALALIWIANIYFTGLLPAIENIWVLSTAAFIAVMGNDYFSLLGKSFFKKKLERFKPYALSILRLGTGASLLVLGFSEKILYPEYGMNFLTTFHWNFMQLLGFQFSDYFFVLAAGTVESLVGLIFILGVVTRINAIFVAIVFAIPMFLLGPIELAGHMPHFAAIILLLLFGNGGHFLLVKKYKDAMWAE